MLSFNEEFHLYKWNKKRVPSVSQIMVKTGFIDDRWYNDEACLRGTYVHLACSQWINGCLDYDMLADELKPYVDAFINFVEISGFVPISNEVMVYNKAFKYAGCYDLIGKLNNKFVLIDLKSGGINDWTEIQLNGYRDAIIDEDKTYIPKKIFGLQLKNNGKFNLVEYKISNIFKSVVDVFNWHNRKIK